MTRFDIHINELASADGGVTVGRDFAEQASVLLSLQRFREAQEIASQAIEVAERARADDALTNARGNLAVALLNQGEPASALEILEELADFQERIGDTRGLESTRTNIAACRMRLGDAHGASFDARAYWTRIAGAEITGCLLLSASASD
jgi:tetratricopeptide (TPR) repeat protein